MKEYEDVQKTAYGMAQVAGAIPHDMHEPVIEHVERLISRVEEISKRLSERLLPVLAHEHTPTERLETVRPEPTSHLRGRLVRLDDAIDGVDSVLRQIDL